MIRNFGRFARVCLAVAATVVLSAGTLVTATSPAAAAATPHTIHPAGWTIPRCLDQHFDSAGAATTLVRSWENCSGVYNQQWRFEWVQGPNAYRIVNHRWDAAGLWCLSAPNGNSSNVYAELCVNPVPLKQTWTPGARSSGSNQLRNELSYQCLEWDPNYVTWVYVRTCDWSNTRQDWFWFPA
ncbi:hypothetical protein [Actinoplanes subglobosus]|uniref:Ricin B lectin domain-containing protein n=1 Tax=Actinoplanes subglobosus TaxID=1547892 RepID=A0ABV8J8W0_9ACTN